MSTDPDLLLVVEDDEDLRTALSLLFEEAGFRTEVATDGLAALCCVAAEWPKVILLDMRMPRMDGWEFSRELKGRYAGKPLPALVVMTAAEDPRARAAEIGADRFVSKPFDLDDVLEAVAGFYRA